MVGPSYKGNGRLISGEGKKEEKIRRKLAGQSTQCMTTRHGWMTTVIKND